MEGHQSKMKINKDYHTYFSIAQFICAVILFLCASTGFILNVKAMLCISGGVVMIFIGLFIIYLCYLLVREAYKELKSENRNSTNKRLL